MRDILIVGGSKGIGNAVLKQQLEYHNVFSISRTEPDLKHTNLTHFSLDVLQEELPNIENIDTLIY